MSFTKLGILLAVTVLAGCGGTGVMGKSYVGRQGSQAWFQTAAPQTIAAYYEQQCAAYGYKSGTADMAGCIQNSAIAGRQSADQRAASFDAGLANASAVYQANQAAAAANRPRMTSCNQFGRTINCTTF